VNRIRLQETADELIAITRELPGKFFERPWLLRRLGIDARTLGEIIGLTATWKYQLRVDDKMGVAFIEAPDSLTSTEIGYRLGTQIVGRNIVAYRSVRSTNDLAGEAAEAGAKEGTIFTAEEQTSGRGRLGRSWHSPYGTGIYVSIVLRPYFSPHAAPGLSVMTGLALADTLSEYALGRVKLKWPNDVLIDSRKVAGILTELSADNHIVNHVVIGVGINVNLDDTDFPVELRPTATSLRRELGHRVLRVPLLQSFLRNLETVYLEYQENRLAQSHDRIRLYSALLGQRIAIQSGKTTHEGVATDIDSEGRLILETSNGPMPIIAGEVTVLKR
jgi:BirA family biotin operon repressor/biotin-[acetyl-CoA-carboxylase] ligase